MGSRPCHHRLTAAIAWFRAACSEFAGANDADTISNPTSTAPGSTRPVTAMGEPWRPCGYPGPTLPFRTPCQCAAACDMQQPVRYNFDFTQRIPSPRIHIGRRVLSSSVLLTFTTTTSVLLTPPESTYRSQIANIRRKQLHPLQDLRRTRIQDHWDSSISATYHGGRGRSSTPSRAGTGST